jgi:hypothetical protein
MRWWDGSNWTEQVQESAGVSATTPPAPPGPAQPRNPKAEARAARAYAKASRPWYKKKRWWLAGAVALIIVISIASASGSGGGSDNKTPAIAAKTKSTGGGGSPSSSPSNSTPPQPKQWYEKVAFGDGSYKVGQDFPPGNYINVNPSKSGFGGCYWQITSDANGNNIVANDNSAGGFPYVTLLKGRYFKSQDCGDWAKVPPHAKPVFANKITDGEWVTGLTIRAGQYRAVGIPTDSAGCYWAVTQTGSNGNNIVANDNVQGGHPQVTIQPGQSFKSQDCGTWKKVG